VGVWTLQHRLLPAMRAIRHVDAPRYESIFRPIDFYRSIGLDGQRQQSHHVNVSYIHMRAAMSGSANNGTYGTPGASNPPWGPGPAWNQQAWDNWRSWHAAKPLWIAAMVLAFIFWWPMGLALLFFGLWSKRVGLWGCGYGGGYPRAGWHQQGGPPPWAAWRGWCRGREQPTSGNHAFDEYRAETLRRLEDEQKEFAAFLERLRFAKDKAEFDQFMAERRSRPPAAPDPEGSPQPS